MAFSGKIRWASILLWKGYLLSKNWELEIAKKKILFCVSTQVSQIFVGASHINSQWKSFQHCWRNCQQEESSPWWCSFMTMSRSECVNVKHHRGRDLYWPKSLNSMSPNFRDLPTQGRVGRYWKFLLAIIAMRWPCDDCEYCHVRFNITNYRHYWGELC